MTLSQDIELLSQVSLFEGFPDEQLRLLAFGSKRLFLRGGEFLYRDGERSDGGYVIVTGQVDMLVERNKREIVLSSQLANSLIGEVALISENRRVASAIARTNCELIFIPRELFKRMLSEYPHLAERLHERISLSVRGMLKEMEAVRTRMSGIADLSS